MAFLCPSRLGQATKEKKKKVKSSQILGRITGSDSVDTLVRVGLEKQHGLSPDCKMVVLKNFSACADKELSVSRGQEVYLLYRENEWSYIITADGKEGFIPSSYVLGVSSNSSGAHRGGRRGHLASSKSAPDRTGDVYDSDSCITGEWPEETTAFNENTENQLFANLPSHGYENLKIVPEVKPFRKTSHGQFIVLFDFQALDENDVTVERAELVQVLNIEDPDWSWVRKYNDLEGFVPKSYICPVEPLKAQEKLSHQYQNTSKCILKPPTPTIRQPLISNIDHNSRRPSYASENAIPRVPMRPTSLPVSNCYNNNSTNYADYQKQNTREQLRQYQSRSRSSSPSRTPRSSSPASSIRGFHTRQSSDPSRHYVRMPKTEYESGSLNDSEKHSDYMNSNSFDYSTTRNTPSSSSPSSQGYSKIHFPSHGQNSEMTNHRERPMSAKENHEPITNGAQNESDITELVMLYDYSTDVQGDFCMKRGEAVFIDTLEQNDPHWFWVYHPPSNKYGYVPRNYVKSTVLKTRL